MKILEYLGRDFRSSLKQWNLVCRAWHQHLRPRLMAWICITEDHFDHEADITRPSDALIPASGLVDSLNLRGDPGRRTQSIIAALTRHSSRDAPTPKRTDAKPFVF
jgi:hypothetical protein